MGYQKILDWKKWNWKKILFIILGILIIHLFQSVNPTKAEVEKAMHEHILEQAQLIGLYERNK